MMTPTVPITAHAVPRADFNGQCGSSPANVYDSFFDAKRRDEEVVGIARVFVGNYLVGWLYRTANDTLYAQALPTMSFADREVIGLKNVTRPVPSPLPKSYKKLTWYSGLVEITRIPRDFRVIPCTARAH